MRHFLFLLSFLSACSAPAQIFTFGVKSGVPVSPSVPGYDSSSVPYLDTGRWTIGPSVELHLFRGLSFEFDALFRGYTVAAAFPVVSPSSSSGSLLDSSRLSVKVWDFPLLLKYRFAVHNLHPFVDAGYQVTHESGDLFTNYSCAFATAAACVANSGEQPAPAQNFGFSSDQRGEVAGAGLEFRYRRVGIEPEVRWVLLHPDNNLITVLIGFTF